MNARTHTLPVSTATPRERAPTDSFIFASASDTHAHWLARALDAAGKVESVGLDPARVVQRISLHAPALLLVDFSQGRAAAASAVASAAHAAFAGLQLIAVGTLAEPECALAALRSGVRDFVDVTGDAGDALRIVRQVLENRIEPVSRHGRLTVLLGARAGMGVTTLAANLGALLARRGAGVNRHAALLDLGLPAGDGAMMLGASDGVGFVEAVRNLRRFDQTFVHTALARHASGLALTTLPADLGALREVSYQAAVALLARLRAFFDQQIVDLGGFTNLDFIAQIAQSADRVWLVCDQCVTSIVAAARLLDALREAGADLANVRLVLNQHEAALDLTGAQIAARLNLDLAGTLPSRRLALCQAANRGELLIDSAPRDPYVRSLDALAAQLDGEHAHASKGLDALKRFLPHSPKRS
jgi:pilus assembly protein CpaE